MTRKERLIFFFLNLLLFFFSIKNPQLCGCVLVIFGYVKAFLRVEGNNLFFMSVVEAIRSHCDL